MLLSWGNNHVEVLLDACTPLGFKLILQCFGVRVTVVKIALTGEAVLTRPLSENSRTTSIIYLIHAAAATAAAAANFLSRSIRKQEI